MPATPAITPWALGQIIPASVFTYRELVSRLAIIEAALGVRVKIVLLESGDACLFQHS